MALVGNSLYVASTDARGAFSVSYRVDDEGQARGRPVGVAIDTRGALLVADNVRNGI